MRIVDLVKELTQVAAAAILFLSTSLCAATAQDLTMRTIVIVTPYAPGGTSDIAIRRIAQKAAELSGINIVIEGKPGGAGAVAAAVVKSAAKDGTTLMLADAGTFAYNVTINPNIPYDPVKDFEPISMLWSVPNVLAVPADMPAKSITEMLEYGKKKDGGLLFASQSVGATGHLLGSILADISEQKMVHVPYRGAAPAAVDVASGRVDFLFSSYPTFRAMVDAGKIKLLATTMAKRDPNFPDLPTVAEQGYPQLELEIWFGLVAPAKTPEPILDALHKLFVKAAESPQLVKDLNSQGIYVKTDSRAQFKALIEYDIAKYKPIIEKAGAVIK